MTDTKYIVEWINDFLEESDLKDHDLHDVKVSIRTCDDGVWAAEITQGGAVLIDIYGFMMRGYGDTIIEAIEKLNRTCALVFQYNGKEVA